MTQKTVTIFILSPIGPHPKLFEFSSEPHTIFPLRTILVLSYNLRLRYQSGVLPSCFITKIFHIFLSSHSCYRFRQSYPP
jgi:hypothetical protein